MVSEVQSAPKPESAPAPVPSQTITDPQPGDVVYVPGFGWMECQGPSEVIYDTEIYENGNKTGINSRGTSAPQWCPSEHVKAARRNTANSHDPPG